MTDDSDDSGETDFDAPWPSFRSGFRSGFYILDDLGRPMQVDDVLVWGTWLETYGNAVEQTVIDNRLFVSTVFLALDHNFGMAGPPVLWETMTFLHDGWNPVDFEDQSQERYRSLAAAIEGHRRWCAIARRRLQEYDASHPAKE